MEGRVIEKLALALMLLGAMPFVGLSLAISATQHGELTRSLLDALFSYAAVILSFLGGIHWGLGVAHAHDNKRHAAMLLYVAGVTTALLAWAILFLPEAYLRLLTFAFLYAIAWGIDSLLFTHKLIPLWYFNLRGIVTPIVVVAMYVAYFSIV